VDKAKTTHFSDLPDGNNIDRLQIWRLCVMCQKCITIRSIKFAMVAPDAADENIGQGPGTESEKRIRYRAYTSYITQVTGFCE